MLPEEKQKKLVTHPLGDLLDHEPNFNKRKMMVFRCLDLIGVDTSDWIERIEAEKALGIYNDNKIRKAGLGENEGPSNRDEPTGPNEPDCFE